MGNLEKDTGSKPVCSLIIRCCNEEKHIGRLLSGIIAQTVKDTEIIVVDSGSTDATLSIASRYPTKIVAIKGEDFSFGYSLNVGCAAATSDLLVIVSAHVYPVHRDWLERLLAPFENNKIALVYGKQLDNERTNFSEHQVFAHWFPEVSNLNQDHPFCNNANSAIRRSLWERFPYDETLTGLEDLAWAKQVMGAGYHIAYEAKAEVIHVHNELPRVILNRYRREAIALKSIFPHERFRFWNFIGMYAKNVISDCFHAARRGMLWGNMTNIIVFRLMQFWGTYRGFAQHGLVTRQLKQKFYYPSEFSRDKTGLIPSEEQRPAIDYSDFKE
jgi:glycosyltransferase involved in cell wall biosynthesis